MSKIFKNRALPLAIILAFFYAFSDTWAALFKMWSNYGRGYDHGFLLLAICLYLARKIHQEKQAQLLGDQTKVLPLLALFILCLTWLAANLIGVAVAQEMLLPMIVLCIIASYAGLRHALLFAFPVLFIYLALPFWDEATVPTLQALTIHAVQFFIRLSGLTAHIYSNYVQIPYGTFEIADSCAGMRYMLIALTLTILHGYLSYNTLFARTLFILWGLLLSLLANWIRVYLIILIGYKTQMQSSIVGDHEMFGWLIFGVTLAPLFLMTPFFARFDKAKTTTNIEQQSTVYPAESKRKKISVGISIIFILLLTKALSFLPEIYNNNIQLEPLPSSVSAWRKSEIAPNWNPTFKNPSSFANTLYSNNQDNISVHLYFYATDHEGAELVSSDNKVVTRPWKIIEQNNVNLAEKGLVMRVIASNNKEKKLIYYWYKINHYQAISPVKVKLYQLVGYFTGSPSGSFIAISKNCEPSDADCKNAQTAIEDFIIQLSTRYKGI